MKALTIHQPYAWAVASGIKRIENRSRPTSHRGPILIHAGKSRASLGEYGEWDLSVMTGLPLWPDLPFGAIIGRAEIVDCLPVERAEIQFPDQFEFAEGPWCWIIAKPILFPTPIPHTGQLGLFEVPQSASIGASFAATSGSREA